MVREAEEHADEDKRIKTSIEARNQLESYLYSLRSMTAENLKNKLSDSNKEVINKVVTDGLSWLENHQAAENDGKVFNEKRKEVEDIANPILSTAYQNEPSNDGSKSSNNSSGDTNEAGPTVEEVD